MTEIWLGVDDTDSPRGGCTTWMLTELVRVARAQGIDLVAEPRLVRLNPNIPWKTRGNAALAARFGHGRGPRTVAAQIDGSSVPAFARGSDLGVDEGTRLFEAAWDRIRALAEDAPGTDPALVGTRHRLPSELYWDAVREVVPISSVGRTLDRLGAMYRTHRSRRGLVGASAAIAWPGRRSTWELISYRAPERWGTPREVDTASVRRAQRAEPDLFLCYDARTRRLLVAPHTACPILYGLRATSPGAPARARRWVRSEAVDRWMLFRTNQASGDHLMVREAAAIDRYLSAIVDGTVASAPRTGRGGHVRFDVRDRSSGVVPCLVFEPTKTLPRIAQSLEVGDRIRVWGSRGEEPGLRLEGLRLVRPVPRRSFDKPTCPACDRRSRSLGRRKGYECPGCGRRWPPEAARARRRAPEFPAGTYHPTPSARRHLALLAPEG
ncbi:MAG: DUF1743 domain-containing protein [Thermoplasmata archaeon]